jgi:hypothetical protein
MYDFEMLSFIQVGDEFERTPADFSRLNWMEGSRRRRRHRCPLPSSLIL